MDLGEQLPPRQTPRHEGQRRRFRLAPYTPGLPPGIRPAAASLLWQALPSGLDSAINGNIRGHSYRLREKRRAGLLLPSKPDQEGKE